MRIFRHVFFVLSLVVISTALAGTKRALSELLQPIEQIPATEIANQLKAARVDSLLLDKWQKKLLPVSTEFSQLVKTSSPFVRGEIENEATMNKVVQFMQLSILECRQEIDKKLTRPCAEKVNLWFQFAADLSYEESSLVGLRFVHLLRSLWFDELERFAQRDRVLFASTQDWLSSLRNPWPIDRVFLSEGKKNFKGEAVKWAEALAKKYQKNPYAAAETHLAAMGKLKTKEGELLAQMWRQKDVDEMKLEINRWNQLRILAAKARYEVLRKKPATTFDQLIAEKLLTSVPIDYVSGRPFAF